MVDLDRDYLEALAILQGTSMMLPEVRHLKAMKRHQEDVLMGIALNLGKLHEDVMNTD